MTRPNLVTTSADGLQAMLDLRYAEGCRYGYVQAIRTYKGWPTPLAEGLANAAFPLPVSAGGPPNPLEK